MKNFVTLLSALALLCICQSVPTQCPEAEDLTPCTCKRLAYGLHVSCTNFNKNADVIRALKVLRDYRVQTLLLHGLDLVDVLPSDLFDGLEIKELRIEKCNMKFSTPAFTGLEKILEVLSVGYNSLIKSPQDFSLARLTKLTELSIKSNKLGEVKNEWLNGKIPNVHTIVLDDNEINDVENSAFQNLVNLKSVSMADNRIKAVQRTMFPRPASVLKIIDLSANELKSLPYDFFFDMPSLSDVILSGNDLTTLPEATWISAWDQLSLVLIFENPLICDEQLDWMRNVKWPKAVGGSCEAPSSLVGKSLKDVYNS